MACLNGSRCRVWNRHPCARDRIWQSMRIMRIFTLPDLVATADAGKANARKYIRGLMRAGYLTVAKKKREGSKGGYEAYHLVRDSGPRAPRLQADGNTYDPNQHKVYEGGLNQ